MCGIFCSISRQDHIPASADLRQLLSKRGPDACNTITTIHQSSELSTDVHLTFTSTVLSLRGETVTHQPYQDAARKAVLCWNGEAWSIANTRVARNDTEAVHSLLHEVTRNSTTSHEQPSASDASTVMSQISGPFAFVYYSSVTAKVYFGRDFLGRRSLLYHITPEGDLLLSSVTAGPTDGVWSEVEADGVYCVDLNITAFANHESSSHAQSWGSFLVTRTDYRFAGETGDGNGSSVGVGEAWKR